MVLTQLLQPDLIKVPLVGRRKDELINELIDLLVEKGLVKDRQAVAEAVFTRERTRSTGIGSGIAIPHGKCKAVDGLVMAMGITAGPVDFESVDDKPVRIVLLLVSPVDQAGPHIQALARISRLMLDDGFRQSLEQVQTAQQAYEIMVKKEAQQ